MFVGIVFVSFYTAQLTTTRTKQLEVAAIATSAVRLVLGLAAERLSGRLGASPTSLDAGNRDCGSVNQTYIESEISYNFESGVADEDAPDDSLVELYAKGIRDLLGDLAAAEVWVAPFHLGQLR